jgi:hypothetical protein
MEVQTNIKQGAVLGGWVCFDLGILSIVGLLWTLWALIFVVPLFLAAYVLSIVAMAQRRVVGGLALLLCCVIVSPMVFLLFRLGAPLGQPRIAVEDVSYNRFIELLDNRQIVNERNYPLQLVVQNGQPTQTLRGAYIRQGMGFPPPVQQVPFRTTVYPSFTNDLQEKLAAAGIQPAIKTYSSVFVQTVVGLIAISLPIAVFVLPQYFLFRRARRKCQQ